MITTLIAGLTCGIATFYGVGDGFHGQRTANGETFDAYRWTAAHPYLPMGSKIRLVISKGPEFIFVPNVLGKSKNSATLDLENLGLRVSIKGTGKVNNISPAIGSKVKQGSLITLTLR